jgi:hypothetical protein
VKFSLNCSPVTLSRSQKALPTTRSLSAELLRGVAPFFVRSATVIPADAFFRASADGVYQICQFGNYLRVTEGYLRMAESPL